MDLLDEMTEVLTAQGKLIEAGFTAYRILVLKDAPQVQIEENRIAYFCGAQHLFSTLFSTVLEGDAATKADIVRVEAIHNELNTFVASMETREGRTQ